MQPEARSRRIDAVAAHPLAELLACPPATGSLLTASAESINFAAGEIIFQQSGPCNGLYLVELAAALGDLRHTYSLVAQTSASLLILPIEALNMAFQTYPPLRMRLLEELAREISRAYHVCCLSNGVRTRRRKSLTPAA